MVVGENSGGNLYKLTIIILGMDSENRFGEGIFDLED